MASGFILEAIKRLDDLILSRFFSIISSLLIVFVYLLIMRGMGSAARSMIYDSSFFYFKDFSILPASPVLLMDLNVLFVSTCAVIAGAMLLLMISKLMRPIVSNFQARSAAILFYLFLVAGTLIFDVAQRDPQGSLLTNAVFASATFFAFLFLRRNRRVTTVAFSFSALLLRSFQSYFFYILTGK